MREYFLNSKNLQFSRWQTKDITLAIDLWGNSQVMKYLSINGFYNHEQIMIRLQQEIINQTKFAVQYWPIFTLDGMFVGCCGLKPYDINNHAYEIGMQILPDFWGKGYATEAVLAVINYARNRGHAEKRNF